jgi:pimeloyl-ACP methyl ester carboxylesterase
MAYVSTSDGVKLYYEEAGRGRPVLLIGGWRSTTPWWRKQVPELAEKHRVVVMDPRSYGRSEKASHGHRMGRYARDVHDLLAALDLRDATAVGWSLGANMLLAHWELFGPERLRGIVLVDQSPCCINRGDWTLGFGDLPGALGFRDSVLADDAAAVRGIMPLLFHRDPGAAEREWMEMPTAAAAAILWDHLNQDWRDLLPAVRLPALVLAGRHSRIFPWQSSAYLAEQLPDARLVTFEESGHCPFYEEPEKFNAAVAEFVD